VIHRWLVLRRLTCRFIASPDVKLRSFITLYFGSSSTFRWLYHSLKPSCYPPCVPRVDTIPTYCFPFFPKLCYNSPSALWLLDFEVLIVWRKTFSWFTTKYSYTRNTTCNSKVLESETWSLGGDHRRFKMRSTCKKTPVKRDGLIISGSLPVAKEPKSLSICSDQAMDWTVHGSKPRRDKDFLFSKTVKPALKPPCPPFCGYRVSSQEVKRPRLRMGGAVPLPYAFIAVRWTALP
jgi:hypothetical protein